MGVSMGVNLSTDTSRLEVCFGGFAPMGMNAGIVLNDVVEAVEQYARERREMLERIAAVEAARASELRIWEDALGNCWSYVVLDGVEVRIEKCETQMEDLAIPDEIEGKPVVALAADSCAHLPSVGEIVCPDTVITIGYCAFRGCKNLRSIALSRKLTSFDSGWLRGCDKLAHLELSGEVGCLDSSIFDISALRYLKVGRGTYDVAPGAFAKSVLETIEVDEANPFLKTDGKALYNKDGSVMVALAVPVGEYRVQDGCKAIARKGFSCFSRVSKVEFPDSVEVLEGFALSRTSIAEFKSSAALRQIAEKAFFSCEKLTQVHLQDCLASIGADAFTGTKIAELRLPASIEEIANPIAAGVGLTYSGENATFSIADGSQKLRLDEHGGLYRAGDAGESFVALLDPQAQSYEVTAGVVEVCEKAFAGHGNIAEVILPDGLTVIGEGAFKGCRSLKSVNVPESVCEIRDEAFLDTNITSVYLPARLERLGKNALVTQGAHYSASVKTKRVRPSLREVHVGKGNTRFVVEGGLLFERAGTDSSMRVLLCMDSVDVVRIPATVNEIAPYAFNGAQNVRELYLSDRIVMVGIRGLAVDCFLELIHVDLVKIQHGRGFFEFRFPDTDRGAQQQSLALSVPDHVNVEGLFDHYDTAITNGSSFDAATEKGLGLYEQATRLIKRLLDPVYLTDVNRSLCERFLRNNVSQVCVELAKHDDRAAIDAMLDLGFLNADNIYAIIDRIGSVQDATMTNYLLEARRLRFEQSVFDDFDL